MVGISRAIWGCNSVTNLNEGAAIMAMGPDGGQSPRRRPCPPQTRCQKRLRAPRRVAVLVAIRHGPRPSWGRAKSRDHRRRPLRMTTRPMAMVCTAARASPPPRPSHISAHGPMAHWRVWPGIPVNVLTAAPGARGCHRAPKPSRGA